MYSLKSLEDVDEREPDTEAPTLRPVGLELEPQKMRPSVWEYRTGEENAFHRHGEQEELYVVLEGSFDATIEYEDDREVLELHTDDFLVVPPESWRQFEALERSRLLVVGAPNVPDDGILES